MEAAPCRTVNRLQKLLVYLGSIKLNWFEPVHWFRLAKPEAYRTLAERGTVTKSKTNGKGQIKELVHTDLWWHVDSHELVIIAKWTKNESLKDAQCSQHKLLDKKNTATLPDKPVVRLLKCPNGFDWWTCLTAIQYFPIYTGPDDEAITTTSRALA